jgi:hypothetical protein
MPIIPGASPLTADGVGVGVGDADDVGVTTWRSVAPVKKESALVDSDVSLAGGAGGTFR